MSAFSVEAFIEICIAGPAADPDQRQQMKGPDLRDPAPQTTF